jgi:O-antigen/teichoic acid export membrane protein
VSQQPQHPVTPGRTYADSTVILLLTKLAGAAVFWALEVALVRVAEPSEWETLARFLTLVTTLAIGQLGLSDSVVYFAARSESVATGLRLTVRTSAILAVVGAAIAIPFGTIPWLSELILGSGAMIAATPLAIFMASELALTPIPSLLVGTRHVRMASVIAVVARLPPSVGALVAVVAGFGIHGALYAMAVGSLLSLIVSWMLVPVVLRERGGATTVPIGEQLSYALPVGMMRLVQRGSVQLDKYVVMVLFSEAVYGTYYLGANEFAVPGLVCGAAMTVLMADLVESAKERDSGRFVALWHASIEKIALVTLPVAMFIFLFAEPIFVAVYGEAHGWAGGQFRIFTLIVLLRVTNYGTVSLALGQPRVPLTAAAIALGINAALAYPFTMWMGISGAAVATVTGVLLSTFYTLSAIRRVLGVPFGTVMPFGRYVRTLSVATAALVPAAPLLLLDLPAAVCFGLGAAVYLAAYVSLLTITGTWSRDDRAFLLGLARLAPLRRRPGS